jgi:hypothetical protein
VCTTKGGDDFQPRAEINKEAPQLAHQQGWRCFPNLKRQPKDKGACLQIGLTSMHPIDKHVISLQMISLQMEKGQNQKNCFY